MLRLLQIDSVFPIEGWLGFRASFKKKKQHSSQMVCFSDTYNATFPENIVVKDLYPLFFLSASFFLGWLARFSHVQPTGNTESICDSLSIPETCPRERTPVQPM